MKSRLSSRGHRPLQSVAASGFERIRVLGISQVTLEPTQEARGHGLAGAFGRDEVGLVGARGIAPSCLTQGTVVRFVRERSSAVECRMA